MKPSLPRRLWQRLGLTGLAAAFAATGACGDQCDQPVLTRGNLDRVADVVVINAEDGQSYAITSNPELQTLRVLDLTAGRFAEAPNQFSPLSIPTGPDTRELTLAADRATGRDDVTRLFALDGSDDVVQVIRLVDGDETPFVEVARFGAEADPVDIAAIQDGDTVFIAVARAGVEAGVVDVHVLEGDQAELVKSVPLPGGSHPVTVVADPLGESFVVGDAALPLLHVINQDDGGLWQLERSLDVGGPVSELAAGVVDVVDGFGPVVVALRSDIDAVVAVRLFRPGFREERYAVLGGAALPALGVQAYVPDARPIDGDDVVTVCCRGLVEDALDAGEATDAFAAVWLSNGDLFYVNLAATSIDGEPLQPGRSVVKLVDDDIDPPSAPEGIDLNTSPLLWVPGEGGDRRPTVLLENVDNFGSPPFIPLIALGTSLLLIWEGALPRLTGLTGGVDATDIAFAADRDVAARGARVGDIALLVPDEPVAACRLPAFRARITSVAGTDVDLDLDDDLQDALTAADLGDCLNQPGTVRLTVEAGGAFVVEDAGRFLGRLAPAGSVGGEDVLELSGLSLSFTENPAGLPSSQSRLAVPLDANVTPMGMNLAAAPRSGVGTAAFVPTGIAGGRLLIPDAGADEAGTLVNARRMVLTSGSIDGNSGLPLLFTCDEGETSVGRVEAFR